MRTEEERPRQRRGGRRAAIVTCLVVGALGLGLALDANSSDSDPDCDTFAQVGITYGGTGSRNGTGWEEAILTALRASNYFEQHPGVDEDKALSAMPGPPPGEGHEVVLDLDGEPRVTVERYGNGWLAGGVRFCT